MICNRRKVIPLKKKVPQGNPLWTKDFTIITLGSVVSMIGNSMSGFAMSLLVLDYTKSTFLYAIYIAVFTLPQMIVPIFSGAILDRFSRKKTIYTLDFVSTGLYLVAAGFLGFGWFNFPVLAVYCFLIGCINSVYMVAYESFYPLLITEGNYQKAYSMASLLETLTAVGVPVSTIAYNAVGIAPLLAINAVCFLTAAILETQIGAEEKYIEKQKQTLDSDKRSAGQVLTDIKEGFRYLFAERGLLAVAIYFTFSSLSGGASNVITLPYFKQTFENGEYIYMIVWGMSLAGRALGGLFHYRVKIPSKIRFTIALAVYVTSSLIEGIYLYLPVPAMVAIFFFNGMICVTSYTIRVSATQSYVPDERKGRFNGAFNMLNTTGSFAGELLAGALAAAFSPRYVLSGFMLINALSALIVIGGNKKEVSEIYNRQE